jgi:Transposase DDE domain
MPPCLLYQRLCQQLRVCVPELGVWPTRRLALLVTGLLLARHTALPQLAARLRGVTPTAKADSIERRLRRILAQTEWNAPAIFEGVARASLRRLPAGRCVLLLDDTEQTDHCTLSTLALAYGGRALPLAWCRWSGTLHGAYWSQVDQLFEQAQRLLPPQVQPVVLADRGLASPRLVKLVQQRGWDFLVRVQGNTTLRTHEPARSAPRLHLGELVTRPGGPNVTLAGWVFSAQPIWAHTAVVWRVGHQEAWLLVSNLDLGTGLADLYAQRMKIEALFRDAKSGGFEWELSRVLLPDRAQRLLLGLMLAVLCAVLLGEAAMRAGEIPAYGRRAHAVSLLRRGLDWLFAPPRSQFFRWTLAPPKTVRI